MNRMRLFTVVVLGSSAFAQSLPTAKVIVSKLSVPTYPRLALQARIQGAVELNIEVRPDGSIESADIVSGHPMLIPAAVESAQKSEFACKECRESLTPYHMTYKFELGEAISCKEIDANGYGIYDANAGTQVSQLQDTITVVGRPFPTCDPAGTISFLKFRSVKCLISAVFHSAPQAGATVTGEISPLHSLTQVNRDLSANAC
jgi:TonB family protein